MEIEVHSRIAEKRPEIQPENVRAAFLGTLRKVKRERTSPVQWVGVGIDNLGRTLEYVAVETSVEHWLIYHSMPATSSVLIEVGLKERPKRKKNQPMKTYKSVDGTAFTDADIELWAAEAEAGFPGWEFGKSSPGRPTSVGANARPFTIRLDDARREKIEQTAKERGTSNSNLIRELIDAM